MQGDSKKQSRKRDPEDLVRQIAHLKSRMGNLQKDIRRLEYDNALLQRKLQTLTSITVSYTHLTLPTICSV